jgi:hypothetical protein
LKYGSYGRRADREFALLTVKPTGVSFTSRRQRSSPLRSLIEDSDSIAAAKK